MPLKYRHAICRFHSVNKSAFQTSHYRDLSLIFIAVLADHCAAPPIGMVGVNDTSFCCNRGCLLRGGVLCDSLGSLGHSALGKLVRQDEVDCSLDLAGAETFLL